MGKLHNKLLPALIMQYSPCTKLFLFEKLFQLKIFSKGVPLKIDSLVFHQLRKLLSERAFKWRDTVEYTLQVIFYYLVFHKKKFFSTEIFQKNKTSMYKIFQLNVGGKLVIGGIKYGRGYCTWFSNVPASAQLFHLQSFW